MVFERVGLAHRGGRERERGERREKERGVRVEEVVRVWVETPNLPSALLLPVASQTRRGAKARLSLSWRSVLFVAMIPRLKEKAEALARGSGCYVSRCEGG